MKCIVYGLSDPKTGETRYIGITKQPKIRYADHLRCNDKSDKSNWIRSLKEENLKPTMFVIQTYADSKKACEAEIFFIAYFRSLGFDLTNISPGGNIGNFSFLKGKPLSEAQKLKIKNSLLGVKHTDERKLNQSLSHLGQTPTNAMFTDEQVLQIRAEYKALCEEQGHPSGIRTLLANKYGCKPRTIKAVYSGQNYKRLLK